MFVCHAPPNISISSKTCDNVSQETFIGFIIHGIKTPPPVVVGAKKNEVGLNTYLPQIPNIIFQFLKKHRIEPLKIPILFCFLRLKRPFVCCGSKRKEFSPILISKMKNISYFNRSMITSAQTPPNFSTCFSCAKAPKILKQRKNEKRLFLNISRYFNP